MHVKLNKSVQFDFTLENADGVEIFSFSKPITMELSDLIIEANAKYNKVKLDMKQGESVNLTDFSQQDINKKIAQAVVGGFFGASKFEEFKKVTKDNNAGALTLMLNIYDELNEKLQEVAPEKVEEEKK